MLRKRPLLHENHNNAVKRLGTLHKYIAKSEAMAIYLCNMRLGYARVSTDEQDTAVQVSALKSAGCEKIFREKASGGRWDRPELHRLLDQLRKGDIFVCWRLDRISRSVRDILMIMERIKEAEAGFKSLTEAIDTTTVSGTMMMQLIAVFAQFRSEERR